MRMLKELYSWVIGLFAVSVVLQEAAQPIEKKKPKRKKAAKVDNWVDGDYESAKDLLSDLDSRYDLLKGVKPGRYVNGTPSSACRVMRNLGVYMVGASERTRVIMDGLDGGADRKYPLVFAVAMPPSTSKDSSEDFIGADRIVTFAEKTNYNHKQFHMQKPVRGWFYSFELMIYMDGKYSSHYVPIAINKNGEPYILAGKKSEYVELPNGKNWGGYVRHSWGKSNLGPSYDDEQEGRVSIKDMEERTLNMFCIAYNHNLRRDASTLIYATKGKIRMAFSVPVHKWKDFFNDRITATAVDGKKKRIFHHVSAHKRANGQVVPMHTRGLTRFSWGEFKIKIAENKKGRGMFSDIDFAATVVSGKELDNPNYVDPESVSGDMADFLMRDIHVPTAERIH